MRASRVPQQPASSTPDTQGLTPEQIVLREFVRVHGLLRRLSEPHFAAFGVSPAQWGILRSLAHLDQSGQIEPRMHELGQSLLVQPPSLSATLDRMERVGLVARRPDPVDQRTRRVGLTQQGRNLLDESMDTHYAWMRNMLGGLSASDLDRLGALLTRLGSHMLELADTQEPAPVKSRSSSQRPATSRRAPNDKKTKRSAS